MIDYSKQTTTVPNYANEIVPNYATEVYGTTGGRFKTLVREKKYRITFVFSNKEYIKIEGCPDSILLQLKEIQSGHFIVVKDGDGVTHIINTAQILDIRQEEC